MAKHYRLQYLPGILALPLLLSCRQKPASQPSPDVTPQTPAKRFELLIPTFLGNDERTFSGLGAVPRKLKTLWRVKIGGDSTRLGSKAVFWSGTGWTGQPLIVRDSSREYILIGGYDHHLRKIDAATGAVIWKYKYDDVIKGTGTLIETNDDVLILQGSRMGFKKRFSDRIITSFRAISFLTGKLVWQFNVPRTASWSRDVDGSPLVYKNKLYLGAENGVFYVLDPFATEVRDSIVQPKILKQFPLFEKRDIKKHGGNLVVESSPARRGDTLYIASGAGRVYGIDLTRDSIAWTFDTGSDMDGTISLTKDGKLLSAIEKEYIRGKGGMLKLDPRRQGKKAVEWFFPTGNLNFASWQGGIICSQSIWEQGAEMAKHWVAFNAIDGNLYVVSLNITQGTTLGFDSVTVFPKPKLLFKKYIGGSISTPIVVGDYLITAGYGERLYVFRFDSTAASFSPVDSMTLGTVESTPVVWKGKIFLGVRTGWFYCLGEPKDTVTIADKKN